MSLQTIPPKLRRVTRKLPVIRKTTIPTPPILELPVEILEQIIALAIEPDNFNFHPPQPVRQQDNYWKLDESHVPWESTLLNLRPIRGLRLSCRSLYHLTTSFVYQSLSILQLHNAELCHIVCHLLDSSDRAAHVTEVAIEGAPHRAVKEDEVNFIRREASLRGLSLPDELREIEWNCLGFSYRLNTPDYAKPSCYGGTPVHVADGVLADLLLAIVSAKLKELHLKPNWQLSLTKYLPDNVVFPSLRSLSIAKESEFPTPPSHRSRGERPGSLLGSIEGILRRAPALRSITAVSCTDIWIQPALEPPRMESVVSMRLAHSSLRAEHFVQIAAMCPNLAVFRYNSSSSRKYWGVRSGSFPRPNGCNRSDFCFAFAPLAGTLKKLDLELVIMNHYYDLDCDLTPFWGLEHLCLDVTRTVRQECGREALLHILPRSLRSLSLMGVKRMSESIAVLIDEILGGGFPHLRFFGFQHSNTDRVYVYPDVKEMMEERGVRFRPGEIKRVEVESAKRISSDR